MNNKSLNKFNSLVENEYIEIKKYIRSADSQKVLLEVPGEEGLIWKHKDISPLFSKDIFPIAKYSVLYNEKFEYYSIEIELI